MWSKLQPSDDGEARVRELIQTGKFWGGMIGRGADHERYDGTREDAIRIVKMILDNAPCKLHIHEEHENGKRLADTAAGQEVTDRLDILKAQHTGIQQGTFNKLTKDVYKYRQRCVENNKEFIMTLVVKSTHLTNGLRYSLATGNWGNQKKAASVKAGGSQVLNRYTFASTSSHLRRTNTAIGR